MSVTHKDVKHIASLARLAVPDEKLDTLVEQLNGILGHMDVLTKVDTSNVLPSEGGSLRTEGESTPLRSDDGDQIPLASAPHTFAPEMFEGFFIVPRLSTHNGGAANES